MQVGNTMEQLAGEVLAMTVAQFLRRDQRATSHFNHWTYLNSDDTVQVRVHLLLHQVHFTHSCDRFRAYHSLQSYDLIWIQ